MYLLDTNHCSYIINGSHKKPEYRKQQEIKAIEVFERLTVPAYTCDVVVGEMYYGAETSTNPKQTYERIETFIATTTPVVTDKECWLLFATTKVAIKKAGDNIGDFDLLIACVAKRYGYILVTNDGNFNNLPSGFIQVENWTL